MASVEDMIKSSICFGVAYDGSVKECKICEVRTKCKAKCECGKSDDIELPKKPTKPEQAPLADKDEVSTSEEAAEKSRKKELSGTAKKPPKKSKNEDIQYEDDMPDFKGMSVEEIEKLLEDRGGNLGDFEKYANPQIRKMRLTMAVKKTYEVK